MMATVDGAPKIFCMVFRTSGRRIDRLGTTFPILKRTIDPSPDVGTRTCLDHSPAMHFRILNGLSDMLVGMIGQFVFLCNRLSAA